MGNTKWIRMGSNASEEDKMTKKEHDLYVRKVFYDTMRIHRMKENKPKFNLITNKEDSE